MLLPEVPTRSFPVKRVPFIENTCKSNFFLKKLQTCARVSFSQKLWSEACNSIKKQTLAQLLFCEFCQIFKNQFFTKYIWATAPVHVFKDNDKSNLTTITWLVCEQVIHFFNERTTISMNTAAEIRLYCTKTEVFY